MKKTHHIFEVKHFLNACVTRFFANQFQQPNAIHSREFFNHFKYFQSLIRQHFRVWKCFCEQAGYAVGPDLHLLFGIWKCGVQNVLKLHTIISPASDFFPVKAQLLTPYFQPEFFIDVGVEVRLESVGTPDWFHSYNYGALTKFYKLRFLTIIYDKAD